MSIISYFFTYFLLFLVVIVTIAGMLVCMEFMVDEQVRSSAEPVDNVPVNTQAVDAMWPEMVVDVAGLSLVELRDRLGLIKRSEARLAAMKTSVLAEYSRRAGEGSARRVVLEELQASSQQARREVETVSQFAAVPATLDALGAGEIPAAHGKQIAKAASQGPVDETVLVEAARTQDFGVFCKTVREHQHQQSGDDGKSLLEKQRERRTLSFFTSPDDGMFILNGRFDPIAGNKIEAALAAEARRIRNKNTAENPKNLTGFDQTLADALENLMSTQGDTSKPQRSTLILTADWDILKQKMANTRLVDGTQIPISEALKLACNADILPAVFNTKTQQLWLGRKHRSATEAQRAALIVRDKHCIGCGRTPTWCHTHHIHEWAKEGPTDINNLVLVCTPCHHNIHDHGWTVHQNPQGKYELRPPPKPHASLHAWQPRQNKPKKPAKHPNPFPNTQTTHSKNLTNQQTVLLN